MLAEVTYNKGRTYRLKQYRFEKNKTVLVSDPAVIKRLQATAGFSVRILDDEKKKAGSAAKKVPKVTVVKTIASKSKEERKKTRPAKKKVAKKKTTREPLPTWASEESKAKGK